MAKIISVSRRTDIPAFYGDWFMKRIRDGFAGFVNPFGGQKYIVSLKPEDVICFVFWSKNFEPFLKNLDMLDKQNYKFYFNFTITGLPDIFECNLIETDKALQTIKQLSEKYSPKHLNWRYDPIVLSTVSDFDYHLKKFEYIAKELKGFVERCYFSFAIMYGKVQRNVRTFEEVNNIQITDPDIEMKRKLSNMLADIASDYGITMYSCCGDVLVNKRIKKAHCIDGEIIKELFFKKGIIENKILPTRKECGCTVSSDIGAYDTCPHGCIYCYANINKRKALTECENHDTESSFLGYSKQESDKFLKEISLLKEEEKNQEKYRINLFDTNQYDN